MNKIIIILISIAGMTAFQSCAQINHQNRQDDTKVESVEIADYSAYSNAYFASGCFWCAEAVFESVVGVEEAISGYSGGEKKDATYERIGTDRTGHAESLRVIYNPNMVSYDTLLAVLFGSHDPTTLNRQGPDRGPQYRSVIFYQNDDEKKKAEKYIEYLNDSRRFSSKIVTEIVGLTQFYNAEEYHQNFERLHPNNGYVKSVSIPRLNRFKRKFPHLLKEGAQLKE